MSSRNAKIDSETEIKHLLQCGPHESGCLYHESSSNHLWVQVEEQVLHFIKQNNRPYNTQLVADHLAQYGLKKGPIQKALDALSEAQKISCKASASAIASIRSAPTILRLAQPLTATTKIYEGGLQIYKYNLCHLSLLYTLLAISDAQIHECPSSLTCNLIVACTGIWKDKNILRCARQQPSIEQRGTDILGRQCR